MKKKKFDCDVNGSIMVTCALRYALGRYTYVPGSVQDWITLYWGDLDNHTKVVIIRDVFEYLYDNFRTSGKMAEPFNGYDAKEWEKFAIDRYSTLTYDLRKEVDMLITSNNTKRKEWFDNIMVEKLYFKSQKKRLEALQKLSDLDQELGLS